MRQCERCGCSPCDCAGANASNGTVNFSGKSWQYQTPEERRIEELAAVIVQRGMAFDLSDHDLPLELVPVRMAAMVPAAA